jgi:hypothetical protein
LTKGEAHIRISPFTFKHQVYGQQRIKNNNQ